MSLDELYRQVILDHYRKPRHAGHIEGADARAEGVNPLCGDEVTVELRIEDGKVTDVAVRGRGCSISQASGSMMADKLIGLSTTEIDELVHQVKRLLDIEPGDSGVDPERPGAVLGDLEALAGVRRFPVRIKCADLPWATLQEALAGVG
ncbi:MAG: SUF system NifU family Fe-S cluster assembly protein [Acidimicrobiia bacterium]